MLELLGFTEPDNSPFLPIAETTVETQAALPVPRPQPTPRKQRSAAPAPRLADVRTGESTENTGVLIARLWEATNTEQPLGEDWTPAAEIVTPRRSFRWSFLIIAAIVVSALAGLGVFAYQWPARQATELRELLRAGLAGLEAESSGVPAVGSIISDADATRSRLTEVAIPLLAFSNAANTAYGAATADPGIELPLVSNAPVEELSIAQLELLRAADIAFDIHEHIGDVLNYRILIEQAFILPATLPVQASDDRISEIGVELSDTLAASTDVLLRLPQNDLLADHRFHVESALADLNSDIAEYLAALRAKDGTAATELAARIRVTSIDVRSALSSTLERVDVWLSDSLDQLNVQLGTTRSALQAST